MFGFKLFPFLFFYCECSCGNNQDVNILTYWRFQHTSFCSIRKLVQATKFFISRATFPASLSNTYFCIDSAVPAHKNVLSLASSSMLNSSSDDIGSLEGLAWITSYKTLQCKTIKFMWIEQNIWMKHQKSGSVRHEKI